MKGARDLQDDGEERISVRNILYITIGWAVCVCVFLAWQAYQYQGIFAAVAEWQFRNFNRMFPTTTIASIAFLLSLPLILVILVRLRRRRRLYGKLDLAGRVSREGLIAKLARLGTVMFAIIALVIFVLGQSASGISEKPVQRIALDAPMPESGTFVNANGVLRLDRIGYYREDSIFTGRELWLAPLTVSNESSAIRVFVEVVGRQAANSPAQTQVEGVIRRDAAPGGLRTLYENEGYAVSHDAMVIFASEKSAKGLFTSLAINFALFALMSLLTWLFFAWHIRRIRKAAQEPANEQ